MFKYNGSKFTKFSNKMTGEFTNKFKYAQVLTINSAAFDTMRDAKSNVEKKFILRNKFTDKSIRVKKALKDKPAIVGSVLEYMATQEFGGTVTKGSKSAIRIPTSFSAGQGRANKRTKSVRLKNRINKISLAPKLLNSKMSNKQKLIVMVSEAVKSGVRYIYLAPPIFKHKGIYQVVGGKYTARGWPKGAKLQLIWDMERDSIRIKKTPWLKPAVDKVVPTMKATYKRMLSKAFLDG